MQLMYRQAYKERGRVNAVGLSFLFFQGLLVETLSRLELGIRIGRGSSVQASRSGEGERGLPVPSLVRKLNRAANGDRVRSDAGMTTSERLADGDSLQQ